VTTEQQTPPDWPRRLHDALAPLAGEIRHLAGCYLAQAEHGPPVFHTDAVKLERAAVALESATADLLHMTIPTAPETVSRTRHDIMNLLNGVGGYSQMLLEAEEDEGTGISTDLERIRDLGRDCQRVIMQIVARKAAPAPTGSDILPPTGSGPVVDLARVLPSNILVVDDDEVGRSAVVRVLRGLGHTLIEASDGSQAAELLRQRFFDMVLLDINMPGMNGYEVLKLIRTDSRRDAMPVLMISGLDEIAHTVRCIEAGAEDFLSKPVDHVLLRARINSLLARRQSRIRELEQFFPPAVARQLLDQPEVLEEGHETDITVLFCDIRGYSRISRRLGPAMSIEWVSSVMEALTERILNNGGVLVDFIGDELMAMWGAPGEHPDHALRACQTALEMIRCLPQLNAEWGPTLGEPMDFGVGLNSGNAWVGNSGTKRKFKYGPSGDTVNVGSRVQGATKYMKARLIVSRATHDRLQGKFLSRRLGRVRVVNIGEPIELFQIVPEGTPDWPELKNRYEEALALYENDEGQGQYDVAKLSEATRRLGRLIADHGAEGPPLGLMARAIEGLIERDKWSSVFQLPGK
jgi:adenylate cyclase